MIGMHRGLVETLKNRLSTLFLCSRRWTIQLASLLVINSYFFPWLKRIPCFSLHCWSCPLSVFSCPLGALQSFAASHLIPLYTIGFLGLTGLLSGRLNCGWFCPFGLLQDLLYKMGVPKLKLNNRFGWARYMVLVFLVGIIPFFTLEDWFCRLCPAGTLGAGIPIILSDSLVRQLIGGMFVLKIAILAVFLVAMVFTKRPFCRFICPLGAIYSIFGYFTRFRLKVDLNKCIKCNRCQKVCPVDIKIYENPANSQCIRCLDCIKVCPVSAIKL